MAPTQPLPPVPSAQLTGAARGPYVPESVLVLLRHGQTDLNRHRLLQGVSDYPLNEDGRRQARLAGEFVRRHYQIDMVVSSPRRRALETLELAGFGEAPPSGGASGAQGGFGPWEVLVEERFAEINYGSLEGEPVDVASARLMELWEADSAFAPPDGESLAMLFERVSAACEELLKQSTGQTVLVSTHATAIKAAVVWALGGEVAEVLRMFLRPASISVIAAVPSGKVVLGVNERSDA